MCRRVSPDERPLAGASTTKKGGRHETTHASEADRRRCRSRHVYRVIEIVGTSEISITEAIDAAIARAYKTLRNLRWFEVVRTSGHVDNGKVAHYQVTLKVGFTMEEP